jgi:hypothetical protein
MEEDSMNGASIRDFFRELFGSRLVESLELQLIQLRTDFAARLQDKDNTIASLRELMAAMEAKITRYECVIMPTASRAGAELVKEAQPAKPNFGIADDWSNLPQVKTRWQIVQDAHEAEIAAEILAEETQSQAAKAPQGTA